MESKLEVKPLDDNWTCEEGQEVMLPFFSITNICSEFHKVSHY